MMTKEEIIGKYPSLCWGCEYSRNVASELLKKGFCGCIHLLKEHKINITSDNYQEWIPFLSQLDSEEEYSGWVMTRQNPFDKEGNETMVNFTLQVKCCKECKFFRKRIE